jgi:hypothetical protein
MFSRYSVIAPDIAIDTLAKADVSFWFSPQDTGIRCSALLHLERMEQSMRDVCADFGAEFREFKVGPSICT